MPLEEVKGMPLRSMYYGWLANLVSAMGHPLAVDVKQTTPFVCLESERRVMIRSIRKGECCVTENSIEPDSDPHTADTLKCSRRSKLSSLPAYKNCTDV